MNKKNRNIRLKAALLILVFSLNTALGFACSLGLNMGYNGHHHHEQEAVSTHSTQHHGHHNEGKEQHHPTSSNSSKDDCCSNGVTSFNLLDKSVSEQVTIVHPVFATAFLAAYFHIASLQAQLIPKNIRAFAQSYHPPIPDIRIAIQSFLI